MRSDESEAVAAKAIKAEVSRRLSYACMFEVEAVDILDLGNDKYISVSLLGFPDLLNGYVADLRFDDLLWSYDLRNTNRGPIRGVKWVFGWLSRFEGMGAGRPDSHSPRGHITGIDHEDIAAPYDGLFVRVRLKSRVPEIDKGAISEARGFISSNQYLPLQRSNQGENYSYYHEQSSGVLL